MVPIKNYGHFKSHFHHPTNAQWERLVNKCFICHRLSLLLSSDNLRIAPNLCLQFLHKRCTRCESPLLLNYDLRIEQQRNKETTEERNLKLLLWWSKERCTTSWLRPIIIGLDGWMVIWWYWMIKRERAWKLQPDSEKYKNYSADHLSYRYITLIMPNNDFVTISYKLYLFGP